MSLNLPGLEECRAEVMQKMNSSLHNIVYGGALDRELFRAVDTKGKTVTIKLAITLNLPDKLPDQGIDDA